MNAQTINSMNAQSNNSPPLLLIFIKTTDLECSKIYTMQFFKIHTKRRNFFQTT